MQSMLQDPVLYWVIWTIATMFGVIIGWWLRATLREKAVLDAYERSEQERNSVAHLYGQARNQLDQKTAELKKATLELSQLSRQAAAFDLERSLHQSALQAGDARLEKAQADAAHFAEKIVFLQEQTQHLRARNEQITAEMGTLHEQLAAWKTLHRDFSALLRQSQELETQNARLSADRIQLSEQLEAARMEIANLRFELLRRGDEPFVDNDIAPSDESVMDAPALAASPQNADDLLMIRGINADTGRRLRMLGITTFSQIGEWDDEIVSIVAAATGVSVDQIRREDWPAQARRLMNR